MPKVNLGKTKKLNTNPKPILNRLIRQGMARMDIINQTELAAVLGWRPQYLSRRMAGTTDWSWSDLCLIFKVLRFTPEEAARAMSVVEGSGSVA